jgi:hypothetical protein
MAGQPDAGPALDGQPDGRLPVQGDMISVPRRDLMQVLNALAYHGHSAYALSPLTRTAVERLRDIARQPLETTS